ncbi:MAG: branched-chain amino acid ABC transporter ATP-binding protein [Actinobacteria bacterium RBG_19FT_COMBO_54_7]|uniref:Branched-chain amino acid ABC transporter ATP-binding protein n=1 Tax=Candidatus Solincola sediminis TaxID=1797199 RepID=A0A1F2WFB8_9ACTN|nr:MAG: branched-chain amino acid ABC transporter ATP-binding protein [Candidatus Solincola sediminis]OFW57776.1 MAG: branched-chain amino acid ABC transporter ATP-binding protein [Candidatus Solincola sediminis]OFW68592.1 MAG: branched-chain amino acid ABC transporter ATP-binding protein [Actinobacteria bacterium RBG_19FT_COMBO_54_7]
MLDLENITCSIGRHSVINGVSLQVGTGDLVCMLGANGAGKSSLFKTISGLIKPSGGSIVFEGQAIQKKTPERIVRMGISLCPEGRRLFPKLSVKKNLVMGAYTRSRDKREIMQSLDDAYDLFPILKERSAQDAGTLSGGEQQMLAIARAMMAKPKLLLLDEPSLGLAPLIVKKIMETIVDINTRGVTILLSEQNASMALAISSRGYVLENGSIVMEGPAAELAGNEEVRKAYIGA